MERPLIIDSFAGGGGASTGIEMAIGRSPDYAIDHSEAALAMHAANHPDTIHLVENIWKVNPLDWIKGKHVGLAWFSPDCKHFSKAKGGKPVEKNVRDLAWVVVLWAQKAKPDVIILENVEEFRYWGPLILTDKGLMPCPGRKGETFNKWMRELSKLGYKVEWRELRACDYGAPTIRKRLFLIARRDKKSIVWPKPTHGAPTDEDVIAGKKKPWRTAAEIIDWSQPCPSIFDTSADIKEKYNLRVIRPLAENTLKRVARGVKRYVLDAQRPFLVNLTHSARLEDGQKDHNRPAATVMPEGLGKSALVTPFLAQHNTMPKGGIHAGRPVNEPVSTITGRGTQQNLVTPFIVEYYGNGGANSEQAPCHTITTRDRFNHVECAIEEASVTEEQLNKARKVAAFLREHGVWDDREYVTIKVEGITYLMWDIGMRMLIPRELFNAQGFPPDQIIDFDLNGKPISKTTQVSCCGNSVSPKIAKALVSANCQSLIVRERAAA